MKNTIPMRNLTSTLANPLNKRYHQIFTLFMKEDPKKQRFIQVFRDFPILFALIIAPSAIVILLLMDNNAYAQSDDRLSSDTTPLSAFIGEWKNPNSKGISKAVVQQLEGGELQAHLFGACMPDYCDWGVANATYTSNEIITYTYRFPFKTSFVTLSLTGDGKLEVKVVNDFHIIGRSDTYITNDILSRSSELVTVSEEPILGVPYPITISNNGTTAEYDIEYELRLSFLGEENKYNISSVDKGTFDSYDILSDDTVVFYTSTLAENENKTGIVVFQFEDGLAEKHRKLGIDANVTSNINSHYNNDVVGDHSPFVAMTPQLEEDVLEPGGAEEGQQPGNLTAGGATTSPQPPAIQGLLPEERPTPSGSISFTVDASYLQVLISVTKIGPELFKLVSDIYDKVTPCVSLEVRDADTDSSSPVVYKVDTNNCSAHPQKIRLSLIPLQQEISLPSPIFTKRLFDISANSTDSSTLWIHVPESLQNGSYPFSVNAEVIMNVFGTEFIVSYGMSEGFFTISRPHVYPSLPAMP